MQRFNQSWRVSKNNNSFFLFKNERNVTIEYKCEIKRILTHQEYINEFSRLHGKNKNIDVEIKKLNVNKFEWIILGTHWIFRRCKFCNWRKYGKHKNKVKEIYNIMFLSSFSGIWW